MTPGDIVLVHFPFTTLAVAKKRPALVLVTTTLGKKVELATVAMITSQVDGLSLSGDVVLLDWKAANLVHPSLVRLAKIATLEKSLIEKQLGALAAADRAAIRRALKHLFRYWVE